MKLTNTSTYAISDGLKRIQESQCNPHTSMVKAIQNEYKSFLEAARKYAKRMGYFKTFFWVF